MRRAVALIEADPAAGDRVVAVRGEIDVGSTPALRDWLSRASGGGQRSVIVDLSGVHFLAVSGLDVLCDEQQRMAVNRVRLSVVCRDPRVLQLLSVCRLDDVLHVVPSRADVDLGPWTADDEGRASRLSAWLQRYSAASA
jgi:anti-sigma B factor antagonist